MSESKGTSRRAFLEAAGGAAALALAAPGASEAEESGDKELVTAFTFIKGIEGMEEALEAHLLSLSAPTRAEPGCVTYDLYRSTVKKTDFLRFEVWKSLEALETHKETPHIRESFARRQREGWTTEITLWKRLG
jgi:quinol monooxygenase YgiN